MSDLVIRCHVGLGYSLIYVLSTRPSRGRLFGGRLDGEAGAEARGAGSLGIESPSRQNWYIRGGPHAAVSGVGEPRERQAFQKGFAPWGRSAFVGSRASDPAHVGSFSPDGFDSNPTPSRAKTKTINSLKGCGPVLPRGREARLVSINFWASAARSFLGA